MTPLELKTRGEAIRHDIEGVARDFDSLARALGSPWLIRLADRLGQIATDLHALVHDAERALAGEPPEAERVTIIPDE